ncbi:PREDICTED: interferon-related developmental regulator 1 [Papilio polytes]|uniref:interferon-related developmental regulator 1 n=1 Tax=Papilio polytes TaxID=76194 RepID=UPI000675BBFC|nr:PREDICTED: interferon-related developmental regulator 1 [Papilio polytes]
MPKGKKKGKYEHKRTEQAYSSDEDAGIDMTIDNCSEISGQSDLKSNHEDAENDVQEKLEEKVLELIESLNARASAARAQALCSLQGALQRRYLAGLLAAHRATLADHVARTLRRGRDAERRAAANLAPLLALQIGEEGTEEFMKEVRPALFAACTDKSASIETRTDCCSSLAVLCYLLEEDFTEIIEVLRMYETIFSGSYLKGDSSVKVCGAAVAEGPLHAAALDGWALVLALAEPAHAAALLRAGPPAPHRLLQLLEACSLEVRMAAGGALAVAHERCVEGGAGGAGGAAPWAGSEAALQARLEQLARDPHKYRAKRDRKLQRATFRDILKYFEEGAVPALRVAVGGEAVEMRSWAGRGAYAALAGALGGGLAALAPHCAPLRHALELPAAPPPRAPPSRLDKLQRHLQNNAACKARTLARNKSRDKRSAALAL